MKRREFLTITGAGMVTGIISSARNTKDMTSVAKSETEDIQGAIVLCNHWTECAIGGTFPRGQLNNRWYNSCFSTVFNIEQSRRWLGAGEQNRFCHELDMYFFLALEKEDPQNLQSVIETMRTGKLELVGGTFGQAESQIFGWESALRQLSLGQTTAKKYIGKPIATYLVEEQSFYSQLPQILKLAGFKYASLQFQNSGTPDGPESDLIWWKGPDGTQILTVPNHAGLIGCYKQWSADAYSTAMEKMRNFKSPLIFQWLELWVPGMDWGASVAPYKEAISWATARGFKQMTLTEYIEWARSRSEPMEVQLSLDKSNYDNNFFQGGWGYENERQARECNQCESLLLSAESLAANIANKTWKKKLEGAIADGWPRLLISQNHDAYLAGSILFYIEDIKTYQSELTFKQCRSIRNNLQKEIGLHAPVKPGSFKLYNPCPWPVTSPVMLEIDEFQDRGQQYRISGLQQNSAILEPVFRSDSGRLVSSPLMVSLPAYGSVKFQLEEINLSNTPGKTEILYTRDNGQSWQVKSNGFHGVTFGPIAGTWKQIGMFFYDHPNTNIESMYSDLTKAPAQIGKTVVHSSCETMVWNKDLMRIKDVIEPALCLRGMAMAGDAGIDFAEFQFRLESIIRFQVGPRPEETWNFQLRLPDSPVAIYADSPYAEEKRQADHFYCSRYIRFELPDRDILWCTFQNTLFRNLDKREKGLFDCKVLDFAFNGVTNWGFRFYAAKKITPADSIRLAESFQRSFIQLPPEMPELKKSTIFSDHKDIVIFHTMPLPNSSGLLVRALNASGNEHVAQFKSSVNPKEIKLVDLLSNTIHANISRHDQGWIYRFRPWEIATFSMQF
jgi:hypothetical protein